MKACERNTQKDPAGKIRVEKHPYSKLNTYNVQLRAKADASEMDHLFTITFDDE